MGVFLLMLLPQGSNTPAMNRLIKSQAPDFIKMYAQ